MGITEENISSLTARAAASGVVLLGVAGLGPETEFPRFVQWLAEGRHAGMTFLEDNRELRADPRLLLEGARSVLVIGLPYYLGDTRAFTAPRIAQYARLKDYHKLLWRRGERLLDGLLQDCGGVGRVVADSAPIMERALAARTGGGFIGKNTCFIHPERGSYYLLGEIITSLDLSSASSAGDLATPDVTRTAAVRVTSGVAKSPCGSCKRCQVHCPTGALSEDYRLDANKCLAYWTIEHRGTIPERFWPWLRYYVFGCDICQLVCPFNRRATVEVGPELVKHEAAPDLYPIAVMTDVEYQVRFGGTPMTRARREGLVRNALIAMHVGKDLRLDEAIRLIEERRDLPDVVPATIAQIRAAEAGLAAAQDATGGLKPKGPRRRSRARYWVRGASPPG